ncbi:BSD domain [Arabidopsis thaliana x Arabidopsis arenosa]|uniref:BSD domain n=1 Tax=Arabidopsis thaliana x Arabidopsis arenosa TaxID=1240361 RepID=A0A8T2B3I7_9BRAS|nr:BSD domain [Arabidopsis thaliana x Arabidopsis arenosa]
MNIASRIRRSFFREKKEYSDGNSLKNGSSVNEEDEEEEVSVSYLGDEDNGMSSSVNVKKDLSGWQEKHAVLVLSKSKELSQLRFKLCPRVLKEDQFWRIYFQLVRKLVAKYEVLAIQQAKIRRMAMEDSKISETKGVYEVEMSETKQRLSTGSATP